MQARLPRPWTCGGSLEESLRKTGRLGRSRQAVTKDTWEQGVGKVGWWQDRDRLSFFSNRCISDGCCAGDTDSQTVQGTSQLSQQCDFAAFLDLEQCSAWELWPGTGRTALGRMNSSECRTGLCFYRFPGNWRQCPRKQHPRKQLSAIATWTSLAKSPPCQTTCLGQNHRHPKCWGSAHPPSPASLLAKPEWAALGEGACLLLTVKPSTASLTPPGLFCLSVCLFLLPGKVSGEQAPHRPDAVLLTSSAYCPTGRTLGTAAEDGAFQGERVPARERAWASTSGATHQGTASHHSLHQHFPTCTALWGHRALCGYFVSDQGFEEHFTIRRRSTRQGLAVMLFKGTDPTTA